MDTDLRRTPPRAVPCILALLPLLAGCGASASTQWDGGPSYLWSAPTGRSLAGGDLLAGVRGDPHEPLAFADVGVTDRLTLMSGFLFRSYGDQQDGEAVMGARVQPGSPRAPVALDARVNLPIDHRLGRRIGEVQLIGARRWGDTRTAFSAGLGWTGHRGFCWPEWELCVETWSGRWFVLAGGHAALGEHVQVVSESRLRSHSVVTTVGLRGRMRRGADHRVLPLPRPSVASFADRGRRPCRPAPRGRHLAASGTAHP